MPRATALFAALFCCSCGGALATAEASDAAPAPLEGGPGRGLDAGASPGLDATTIAPRENVPIDVTQWRDSGPSDECGFEISGAVEASVSGDKVVAFRSGNEIPVVVFGCSGLVAGKRHSFMGSGVPNVMDGQWALLDVGEVTYFIDNSHVASCAVAVVAPTLEVGRPASGSFACSAMPGPTNATATVSKGQFATSLVMGIPFKLPR